MACAKGRKMVKSPQSYSHMAPLIAVFLITLLNFIYAMKQGIVRILASSVAVAIGVGVFFAVINYGPSVLDEFVGLELSWEFLFSAAGIFGVIAYFISWAIGGFVFKFLFNPDSFLHPLVDGIPGGIISLIPSLVMAFVILTGTRITGTVYELSYAASIAQPAIAEADLDKLPSPSKFTVWRNTVEKIPFIVDLLDKVDPFSRRENRNFGLVSLFSANQPAREFSEGSSQMATILSNPRVLQLINSEGMSTQMVLKDKVGLVLGKDALEIASLPELKPRLKALKLDRHVEEFVQFLKTNKTPNL